MSDGVLPPPFPDVANSCNDAVTKFFSNPTNLTSASAQNSFFNDYCADAANNCDCTHAMANFMAAQPAFRQKYCAPGGAAAMQGMPAAAAVLQACAAGGFGSGCVPCEGNATDGSFKNADGCSATCNRWKCGPDGKPMRDPDGKATRPEDVKCYTCQGAQCVMVGGDGTQGDFAAADCGKTCVSATPYYCGALADAGACLKHEAGSGKDGQYANPDCTRDDGTGGCWKCVSPGRQPAALATTAATSPSATSLAAGNDQSICFTTSDGNASIPCQRTGGAVSCKGCTGACAEAAAAFYADPASADRQSEFLSFCRQNSSANCLAGMVEHTAKDATQCGAVHAGLRPELAYMQCVACGVNSGLCVDDIMDPAKNPCAARVSLSALDLPPNTPLFQPPKAPPTPPTPPVTKKPFPTWAIVVIVVAAVVVILAIGLGVGLTRHRGAGVNENTPLSRSDVSNDTF